MKCIPIIILFFYIFCKNNDKYKYYKINKITFTNKLSNVNFLNKFDLKINYYIYNFSFCIFNLKSYNKNNISNCIGSNYFKINKFYENFKNILIEKLYVKIKSILKKFCKNKEIKSCKLLESDLKILFFLKINFYFNIKYNKKKYLLYEGRDNKILFDKFLYKINVEEIKTNHCFKYLELVKENWINNFKNIIKDLKNNEVTGTLELLKNENIINLSNQSDSIVNIKKFKKIKNLSNNLVKSKYIKILELIQIYMILLIFR